MAAETPTPLSGRKAQAARNDEVILAAAREVFLADPGAPISAVAQAAGVGMSALYRRYPSKEDLIRRLCRIGLQTYIDLAEACVADDGDPWEAFATFMRRAVEAHTNALTLRLAGTFTPDQTLWEMAEHAGTLNVALFDRTMAAGVIRPDVTVADLGLIFEQLAAIAYGATPERTALLRQRSLGLILEGLRADPPTIDLPAPGVTDEEFDARWVPRT
ncbi:MAG TPA: TetR/AcrR family transcriptional regulator [Acidimicrobiales bacterium]|nr:TetR/AcrR family transcriptional regulator [Acidimicrobiales bacterium]